jgi:hypothetical protein
MKRALTISGVLLVSVCLSAGAIARYKPEYASQAPEVQAWYEQQHNAKGEWCCNNSDGHPYYGDVKMLPDGGVELDGGVKIPAYMVLSGPNPTGHAVWWYLDVGAQHRSYCFALPSLS